MAKQTPALVTDVRYRMSLPLIRSLGQRGLPVIAAERQETPARTALGFYSKYTTQRLRLPNPNEQTSFLSLLDAICKDNGSPVVFPVGIDTLTLLSKNAAALPHATLLVPEHAAFQTANDKTALMAHAKQIGIPCPETTTLDDGEAVQDLAARIVYPAVIKYRAGELLHLPPQKRYAIVPHADAFQDIFKQMHQLQPYPLVQEYVSGGGFGVSAVFDRAGNPHTVFCHRRLREYPASGGPSCFCESAWDDTLVAHAITLLKSLHWRGVAMVEFKGSPQTGWKLMEINPRFWGSLALAPISGCDIATAYYHCALGTLADGTVPGPSYRVGKRMRFLLQDALSLPQYLKKAPNKLAYGAAHCLSLLHPAVKDGVFSWRDPKPGFRYLQQAIQKRTST